MVRWPGSPRSSARPPRPRPRPDVARPGARRAAAPAARADAASYAADAVRATNAARVRRDLRPLAPPAACAVPRPARRPRWRARGRSGTRTWEPSWATAASCTVGENVAAGYPTGRAVVKGWMGSPGHRANILQRRYRLVAVAARRSDSGTWYAAQVFGRR